MLKANYGLNRKTKIQLYLAEKGGREREQKSDLKQVLSKTQVCVCAGGMREEDRIKNTEEPSYMTYYN